MREDFVAASLSARLLERLALDDELLPPRGVQRQAAARVEAAARRARAVWPRVPVHAAPRAVSARAAHASLTRARVRRALRVERGRQLAQALAGALAARARRGPRLLPVDDGPAVWSATLRSRLLLHRARRRLPLVGAQPAGRACRDGGTERHDADHRAVLMRRPSHLGLPAPTASGGGLQPSAGRCRGHDRDGAGGRAARVARRPAGAVDCPQGEGADGTRAVGARRRRLNRRDVRDHWPAVTLRGLWRKGGRRRPVAAAADAARGRRPRR